ncbi:MAG TPA: hypothetical protein VN661_10600 [Candidatus Acidoferrales bacterium]|nr:hypothetical protein [Candidatus Acidoferrales bacterium]
MLMDSPGGKGPVSQPEPGKGMRTYWRISAVVIALAVLYAAGILWLRWQGGRDAARKQAADQAAKQREADQGTLAMMGGGKFDILNFYASPATVKRGDSAQLCYGVSNTKSVKLDPQVNAVWPSYSRCVGVSPRKTTTYTLTATDASGNKKTATLIIHVR